jgi:UDP-glucose-4-epimerase GalE
VTFDNLSTGRRELVRWGPLIEADLADVEALRRTFVDHAIGAVLHFAANSNVGESVKVPRKYVRDNAVNGLALLDACVDHRVHALVFSSTCSVYGSPTAIPITEDAPRDPVNPYGDSKLFLERAIAAYGRAHQIGYVALRYFNAAGADLQGEAGELHDPESHLIPLAIAAAHDASRVLDVLGTDYPTPDGTAIRDYVHVADLATAHVAALRRLLGGGASGAFNLGAGTGHSVRAVVDAVTAAVGRAPTVRESDRRAGDAPVLVADPTRAREALGWNPTSSDLGTIVTSAAMWHASRRRGA